MFFFSSRRRHTRCSRDWSSDVCSSDLEFARLSGDGAITSDNIEKAILAFLETQPRSIVLQRLETGAFTPAPALTLFAGHQAFMGWTAHENLWRGLRADVGIREREVTRFYAGEMPDAMQWRLEN